MKGSARKPPLELEFAGDARVIELDDEAVARIEAQREAFIEKFGREPGPDDPIFFNPDAEEPEPLSDRQMAALDAIWEEHGLEEQRALREAELEAAGKTRKVGRNDPCWCGSGKKFKKCHGA